MRVYRLSHPRRPLVSPAYVTLSAIVYNYNNNINIIVISINTFKVRDGRIRVYKKYVYKCVPLQVCVLLSSNARDRRPSIFRLESPSNPFSHTHFRHRFTFSRATILVRIRLVHASFASRIALHFRLLVSCTRARMHSRTHAFVNRCTLLRFPSDLSVSNRIIVIAIIAIVIVIVIVVVINIQGVFAIIRTIVMIVFYSQNVSRWLARRNK